MIKLIDKLFSTKFSRKRFIQFLSTVLAMLMFNKKRGNLAFADTGIIIDPRKKRPNAPDYDLVACKGRNPDTITREAIRMLGGMEKFVRRNDIVVVKPNMAWDRTPEQAANTNPEVVKTVVEMCFEAGAKVVKVFDNTCNNAANAYEKSGIQEAAKEAKAVVYYVSDWKFYKGNYPKGSLMNEWPMFKDAVECDCFINIPVAKHHRLAKLTLSIKNLMGVCGGSRGQMHVDLDTKLAEVVGFIKPDLTIIDAYRILLRNGPTGGDLADVEEKKTVVASNDPVLADAYATRFFDMKPEDIGYIKKAAKMGFGSMDLAKAKIKEIASYR